MLSQTSRTASGDGDGERERQGWREKEKRIAAVCVLPCASLSLSLLVPSALVRLSFSLANIAHAPIITINGRILRIPELSRIRAEKRRQGRGIAAQLAASNVSIGALSSCLFPHSPLFSRSLYLGEPPCRFTAWLALLGTASGTLFLPANGFGDPCPSAVRDASHQSSLSGAAAISHNGITRAHRAFDSLGARPPLRERLSFALSRRSFRRDAKERQRERKIYLAQD